MCERVGICGLLVALILSWYQQIDRGTRALLELFRFSIGVFDVGLPSNVTGYTEI